MTPDIDTLLRLAEAAHEDWNAFIGALTPSAIIALCKRVKELEVLETRIKTLIKNREDDEETMRIHSIEPWFHHDEEFWKRRHANGWAMNLLKKKFADLLEPST